MSGHILHDRDYYTTTTGGGSSSSSSSSSSSKGALGWVRGLFLPPAFDSWPLPLVAVLMHLTAALLAPLLLRLKGSGAQSKRAAILARMPSADGTIPPPPPPPQGTGASGAEQSKSIVETMAQQMGLGPLLGEAFGELLRLTHSLRLTTVNSTVLCCAVQ
jgi:hypothetical protein